MKKIAGSLKIQTNGLVPVTISQTYTSLHNHEVLIIIAQDGVAVGYGIEIVVLESLRNPRH